MEWIFDLIHFYFPKASYYRLFRMDSRVLRAACESACWKSWRLQDLVRRYDAPWRFVPFLAFESSHKSGYSGDNNAYYLGTEGRSFWMDREDLRGGIPCTRRAETPSIGPSRGRPVVRVDTGSETQWSSPI